MSSAVIPAEQTGYLTEGSFKNIDEQIKIIQHTITASKLPSPILAAEYLNI